ncbi:MAG: histone deacetylase [Pirellulaceae bacterium]
MQLFYSDTFVLPLPEHHRFPMAKYRLLRERIDCSSIASLCEMMVPDAATDEQLLLAHDADYLCRMVNGDLTALEIRRIGFPWSPQMVERSRRSTGASISAARSASRNGVAVNLAGGTHHASRNCGGGYCVFNDACVAAKVVQLDSPSLNVLILDLDVHQGNGTADICANDESVFTVSLHCDKNYPFLKAQSDLDVALPEGIGDEEYLAALDKCLAEIEIRFEPDFVFYLAGADPYVNDRLGRMRLTKHGLSLRDQRVFDWCFQRGLPVSVAMAGGYAPDVEDIVDIHYQTVELALAQYSRQPVTKE